MTITQRWLLWIYAAIVAIWPIRHLVLSVLFRRLDVLTRRSPRYSRPDPPLISAIIPAKDEESTLADCLASVQAQTYPNLEILVVDDRSTDRTAAIARAAAAADERVRVLSITELPAGWTGKAHALHVAAQAARGDWFWFLDADTRHAPDSLSIVLEYARTQGAALASLLPEMRCETFWEGVVQPLSGIVLMRSYPPFVVNRDTSRLAFANGQYILIHRSAYEAAGGHAAVRDRFVEDIHLARRVKALGLPIRVAIGTEISATRMYTSLPQLVRGWSRILYDALDRRVGPLVGKIVEPLVFSQTGLIALVAALALLAAGATGPFPSWLLGLSLVHLFLQFTVLYRMYRLSSAATAWYAAWYPLAGLVSDWILLQAIALCLTGRVTWRGTSYGPAAAGIPRLGSARAAPDG
ncbi:MAG: glycosyltransferase [Isosphaeraceae bacterium]|nr:glycosyltransferase [Isosphaeraceae bacterium]